MSDNRSLQRADQGRRAGAIMTPQGPAIIQVIDIPSGGGGLGYAGPATPARKPGGINILGAILRRWWLVLIVTVLIGGAGIYAGNNFVKPVYIAHAKVSWIDRTGGDGQGTQRLISQATDVLTSLQIPVLVAKDPDVQRSCAWLSQGRDLDDPAVQADVIKKLKDTAIADSSKAFQTVDLQVTRKDPNEAAVLANAFARAFVQWCINQLNGDLQTQIAQADEAVKNAIALKGALSIQKTTLMVDNKIDQDALKQTNAMAMATKVMDDQIQAKVKLAAAEAKLLEIQNSGIRRPDQELQAIKMVEDEKLKDNVLQTYNAQLVAAIGNLQQEMAIKTEAHPDVKRAQDQVTRMKAKVLERETEIASIIREKIDRQFRLTDAKTVEEAKEAVKQAQAMLDLYNKQLAELDERTKKLVSIKNQIQALDDRITLVSRDYESNYQALQQLKNVETSIKLNSGIKIAEYAVPPELPDQDKRVKVQAAGMVGGLFLGMLLALLVD
ncbi:MAG TPA: hypothetical protein VH475_24865, partial [Tepidisphaeraceae bacterium]